MAEGPTTIWDSWLAGAEVVFLRRWMLRSRSLRPLMKWSLENSHLSGSAFLKPWRMHRRSASLSGPETRQDLAKVSGLSVAGQG